MGSTQSVAFATFNGGRKPTRDEGSVGWDIYSNTDVVLEPNTPATVSTGLTIRVPSNLRADIRSRSGYAFKHDITSFHGLIDPSYSGELRVRMTNIGKETVILKSGSKIAQLVFTEVPRIELVYSDIVDDMKNNTKGFGSTGF